MDTRSRAITVTAGIVLIAAVFASGETRKELHFSVGRKAMVSINNEYGPITVKPNGGKEVVVTIITYSDKVDIAQSQRGSRVDVAAYPKAGADAQTGRVDFEVLVPAEASVTLRSTSGSLHVEKLRGDVSLEETAGDVDVRDFSGGHVHIKTLDGPIMLTNVHDGHVEITSVGGNIILNAVSGPLVQVNSTSGNIQYDGDFGAGGEYMLTSHTGNIDAIAPAYASIDVVASSVNGQVENDFLLQPEHIPFISRAGSAFAGTMNKAASQVKLLSFSGRIHLKKR
jgi:DUF4097 and DUF4098 domain-containing protein YvlB